MNIYCHRYDLLIVKTDFTSAVILFHSWICLTFTVSYSISRQKDHRAQTAIKSTDETDDHHHHHDDTNLSFCPSPKQSNRQLRCSPLVKIESVLFKILVPLRYICTSSTADSLSPLSARAFSKFKSFSAMTLHFCSFEMSKRDSL